MSEIAEKIKHAILKSIESDTLVLPTLPEVALRVRDIADNPDSSVSEVVDAISTDAALTARIIRVCNSPLLRGSQEITAIGLAVNRLGMQYTSNLATGLAMEQLFQATTELVDKKMREVWQKSTEIAGISHVLCQHYTKLKPDQATLAGLTHLIGVLPILRFVEDKGLQVNKSTLETVIDSVHAQIGTRILLKWDFPAELIQVPQEYTNFSRTRDSADYADIVMISNLQTLAGKTHPFTQMDWSNISAFNRLGLDPQIDFSEAEDLNAEMEAAMALLKS